MEIQYELHKLLRQMMNPQDLMQYAKSMSIVKQEEE